MASGERLWCGTCHDPHSSSGGSRSHRVIIAAPASVVMRGKGARSTANARASVGDDCTSCHMPKGRSREGEHVVYTDHTIARRPVARTANSGGSETANLLAITRRAARSGDRLCIVWRPTRCRCSKALQPSDDAAVLVQIGQFYDALGKQQLAEAIYERVLRLDPSSAAAAANLAIYRARKGRSDEAIALWQDVFSRNPALAVAGINLAVAQLEAGDRKGAGRTLQRLLQFHPDLDVVRQLLSRLR